MKTQIKHRPSEKVVCASFIFFLSGQFIQMTYEISKLKFNNIVVMAQKQAYFVYQAS